LFISLVLVFAVEIAAQERTRISSGTTAVPFRGQSISVQVERFSDGTVTKTYRDGEGNPLPEMESNYLDGYIKSASSPTASELSYRFTAETDTPALIPIIVFGENPEFRAYTGISLEQVRQIILAQWDSNQLPENHPTDEVLDLYTRRGKTDDATELDKIGMELWMLRMKEHEELKETMTTVLSPEQRQKLRELEWIMQTMQEEATKKLENENVAYGRPLRLGIYKNLGLSAEQQKQLEALKAECFQALSEHFKGVRSGKAMSGVEAMRKINEISEAIQPKLNAMLTRAQKTKLEQLLANPPKFLTAPPAPKKDAWMPGPNSWKPGDPIPEGRIPPLPPPSGRFPRSEL
jgi:hypothetical protein